MKSLIGVMTLGVASGSCVEIMISGEDEADAMQRLEMFFGKELQDL